MSWLTIIPTVRNFDFRFWQIQNWCNKGCRFIFVKGFASIDLLLLIPYFVLSNFVKPLANWLGFSIRHHVNYLLWQLINLWPELKILVFLPIDLLSHFLALHWLIFLVLLLIRQKFVKCPDLGRLRNVHTPVKHHLTTEGLWLESALWLLFVISVHLLF